MYMQLTNLQLMSLRPPKNPIFHSAENVIWITDKKDDTATAKRLRSRRPPAVIREKETVNHDHLQCLSVKETAKLLSVVPITIHRMLNDGRLKGPKDGRIIRVFQWSLEQYLIENTTVPDNQDPTPTTKPKRIVKTTSHQVAMRELERMGILS